MPRASTVFDMNDAHISTVCPSCGTHQTLAQATINESDRRSTSYHCRACTYTILTVQTRGRTPWDGIGHRIRSWTIKNPYDLYLQSDQMDRPSVIRASPHALDVPAIPQTQSHQHPFRNRN